MDFYLYNIGYLVTNGLAKREPRYNIKDVVVKMISVILKEKNDVYC